MACHKCTAHADHFGSVRWISGWISLSLLWSVIRYDWARLISWRTSHENAQNAYSAPHHLFAHYRWHNPWLGMGVNLLDLAVTLTPVSLSKFDTNTSFPGVANVRHRHQDFGCQRIKHRRQDFGCQKTRQRHWHQDFGYQRIRNLHQDFGCRECPTPTPTPKFWVSQNPTPTPTPTPVFPVSRTSNTGTRI